MTTDLQKPKLSYEDERAWHIVNKLFKNDYGEPFDLTPGQITLFRAIYEKQYPRVQFDCYTQYGKSDTVSMAVLLRATTFAEKWPILGATSDKARIIVEKLIKHIFENDYTLSKFEIAADESVERIRRERSKDKLTFKVDDTGGIGTVIAMSADARRKSKDAGDILIGHGAPNLIEDDAALIPDPIHGKALRMLGGHKNNFLLKITNSFNRNHAYRSRIDPKFHKIVIDYKQGLEEGRLTQEYIDEMRQVLDPVMFGILYECVYPPEDMIEDGGWMQLLTTDQVKEAESRATVQAKGEKRMALDPAEGTNFSATVIRYDNLAKVKGKSLEKDPMKTAEQFVVDLSEERVQAENAWIDAVGLGSGIYARVRQLGPQVNAFKGGDNPTKKTNAELLINPTEFKNLKAECFWKMRDWILQGGALVPNADWAQLAKIRYRITVDKKIEIMPKEVMRALGYLGASESTDVPDGLSMTFAPSAKIEVMAQQSQPLAPFYPEIGI